MSRCSKDPPTAQGGLSYLLPTHASKIYFLSLASTRNYILRTNSIYDYAEANEELADKATEVYFECCGKYICRGCIYSFVESGNLGKCPFCKAEKYRKTDEEKVDELMKRVEANDAESTYLLGSYNYDGKLGLQQDLAKGRWNYGNMQAELGSSEAHFTLGTFYHEGGDMKKAKIHYEAGGYGRT
jgi:TPR repeat protein